MLNAYGITWKNYFADLPTVGLFPYVLEDNPGNVGARRRLLHRLCGRHVAELQHRRPRVVRRLGGEPAGRPDRRVLRVSASSTRSCRARRGRRPRSSSRSTSTAATTTTCRRRAACGPTTSRRRRDPATRTATCTTGPASACRRSSSRRGRSANYVSHTVYDHTSILRLVESKWNLPALSNRDANAHPMLDCFDFRSPAFLTPPVLQPAPAPSGTAACLVAAWTPKPVVPPRVSRAAPPNANGRPPSATGAL